MDDDDLPASDFERKVEGDKEISKDSDLRRRSSLIKRKNLSSKLGHDLVLTLKVSVSPRPFWSETENTLQTHDVIVSGAVVKNVADPLALLNPKEKNKFFDFENFCHQRWHLFPSFVTTVY